MVLHPEIDTAFAVWRVVVIILMGLCICGGILTTLICEYWASRIMSILAGIALAGIIFGIWAWATWPPFDMQYHTYQPTTITVANVGTRIIDDGNNSVSERFAILGANGQTYGCDDTRCSVLDKGETITLLCEEEWEANGVPGYVCNWGKVGTN